MITLSNGSYLNVEYRDNGMPLTLKTNDGRFLRHAVDDSGTILIDNKPVWRKEYMDYSRKTVQEGCSTGLMVNDRDWDVAREIFAHERQIREEVEASWRQRESERLNALEARAARIDRHIPRHLSLDDL